MSRAAKKIRARKRRLKRLDLVHAAGCTEPDCIVRLAVFEGHEMINEACADGIRIPRSIVDRMVAAAARTYGGER